jgi:membrane associated rhomboid family serine protease
MSSISEDLKARWASGGMAVRLVMFNALVFLILATLRLLLSLGLPLPVLPGAFGLATTADLGRLAMRPWSAITHMFAHTEVWHLVMNMLILWWMGGMFRSFFGDRRTLSTYLMGGISGFLLFVVATNLIPAFPQGGYALGASSAVMALMVATATYVPDTVIRLFLIGPVKLKWVALAYVVLDYVALSNGSNIGGHLGHIGGAVYGYAYIRGMKRNVDLGAGLERLIDGLVTGFGSAKGKGTKSKRSRRSRGGLRAVHRKVKVSGGTDRAQTDEEFNADKLARQQRIDRILDKISSAGYDQLTKEEKDFLFKFGGDL